MKSESAAIVERIAYGRFAVFIHSHSSWGPRDLPRLMFAKSLANLSALLTVKASLLFFCVCFVVLCADQKLEFQT